MKTVKIALLLLTFSANAFAITGEEALARFRGRMAGIEKMTGIISWSSPSGYTYTGAFKYLNPGRLYIKFSNPNGKIIVSSGKRLWVYDPASNICGIQDLAPGSFSGGIASFVNGYNGIVTSQGSGGYTLKLRASDRTYPEIILQLDASFLLRKAVMKNKDGEAVTFSLSNVDMGASVMKNIFEFSVPANTQVVKNPLDIK